MLKDSSHALFNKLNKSAFPVQTTIMGTVQQKMTVMGEVGRTLAASIVSDYAGLLKECT